MKTYVAMLVPQDESVIVVQEPGKPNRQLDLRLDLMNHSPTGFMWGYEGSGPAQTALAILSDHFSDRQPPKDLPIIEGVGLYFPTRAKTEGDFIALQLYQNFKRAVISRFDMNAGFTLTGDTVATWCEPHVNNVDVKRARELEELRADLDLRR